MNTTLVKLTLTSLFLILVKSQDVEQAWHFVEHNNVEAKQMNHDIQVLAWEMKTNLEEESVMAWELGNKLFTNFTVDTRNNASQYAWKSFENETLRLWFSKLTTMRSVDIQGEHYDTLRAFPYTMADHHRTASVCLSQDNCMYLPGLVDVMLTSRDYNKLTAVWIGWRDVSGKTLRRDYRTFVQLLNESVQTLGIDNYFTFWMRPVNMAFVETVHETLDRVRPLYAHLHAYVRKKLINVYGDEYFPYQQFIPEHLLGDMWGKHWTVARAFQPFPGGQYSIEVTPQDIAEKYTVRDLVNISDQFYISLGMKPMSTAFWEESIFEQPSDQPVFCEQSSWNFHSENDYRILYCGVTTMECLLTFHRLVGEIQFYMHSKDLPMAFQNEALPGFLDAITGMVSLSVSTRRYLGMLDLVSQDDNYNPALVHTEKTINFLYDMAVDKLPFLQYAHLSLKWHFDIFTDNITPGTDNRQWWKLRCIGGVSSPVRRNESDFDPGADEAILKNDNPLSDMTSFILQFQIYKAMCSAAGHTGPLYKCDIYGSKEAGALLKRAFETGSSRNWSEVLYSLTGSPTISTNALLEYFGPLLQWLEFDNYLTAEHVGWNGTICERNVDVLLPDVVDGQIKSYNLALTFFHVTNTEAKRIAQDTSTVAWEFNVNLTNDTLAALTRQLDIASRFTTQTYRDVNGSTFTNVKNVILRRWFQQLTFISVYDLSDAKYDKLRHFPVKVQAHYRSVNICLNTASDEFKCMGLNGIQEFMATSKNIGNLQYVWHAWHDASGKPLREAYEQVNQLFREADDDIDVRSATRSWRAIFNVNGEALLNDLIPLHDHVRTYVRRKLAETYHEDIFPFQQYIPAHLLGDLWAKNWNLEHIFQVNQSNGPTHQMLAKNYSVRDLVNISDQFYISLGMEPMTAAFWEHSIFEKPSDGGNINCVTSTWDFHKDDDYRLLHCGKVTLKDLITIHRSMGEIQFYMHRQQLPIAFQVDPIQGFMDSVTGMVGLSVLTKSYLNKIGIHTNDTGENDIDFLLQVALDKIPFIWYAYTAYKWQVGVYEGSIREGEYNTPWWYNRCHYEGISAPEFRSNRDFDPGADDSILNNYLHDMASTLMIFQVYKGVCNASGHIGPLHKCDISGSKEAGELLSHAMTLGASDSWASIVDPLTGNEYTDADSLLEYFHPLLEWLKVENVLDNVLWEIAPCRTIHTYFPDPEVTRSGNASSVPDVRNYGNDPEDPDMYDSPAGHPFSSSILLLNIVFLFISLIT